MRLAISTTETLTDLKTDLVVANNNNNHRTDSSKLWRTIKGIDGKSKQTAENEGITFTGRSHTSPKLIANSFNRQFTTSKLGKHSSSRRTRHVSKDVKRMSLEQAESFTSDQVTSAIKSCRSSRAYGPDTLSIFHLKNLGPLAIQNTSQHSTMTPLSLAAFRRSGRPH